MILILEDNNHDIQTFAIDKNGNRKGIMVEKQDKTNYLIITDKKTDSLDDRYASCENKTYALASNVADLEITYYQE